MRDFDAGPPPPPRDAGPPPCFERLSLRLAADDAARECGLCLEPHAHAVLVARSYGTLPVPFQRTIGAVPEGLVIMDTDAFGPRTYFVGATGDVLANPRVTDLVPWPTRPPVFAVDMAVVPERDLVWFVGSEDTAFGVMTALYQVGPFGWRRIVGGMIGQLDHPLAVATTDGALVLVGTGYDGNGYDVTQIARVTQSANLVAESRATLDDFQPEGALGWALALGNVALVHSELTFPPRLDHLSVITPELEHALPIVGLNTGIGDEAVIAATRRRSGGASLALASVDDGSLWLLRVYGDGRVQSYPPGTQVNPDYLYMALESSPPLLFSDGSHGLVWRVDPSLGEPRDVAQVVDATDARVFVPPLALDGTTARSSDRWAFDGADRAYVLADTEIRQVERTLEAAWSISPHDCGSPETVAIAGAYEGGVWLVWNDRLEDSDGLSYSVTKVTRILADGSFTWSE